MLTVLWRKPDGAEMLFAAESVERMNGSDEPQVPVSGKFVARGIVSDSVPGDHIEFEIEKPFGAVFVMNDKGQTVARYMSHG